MSFFLGFKISYILSKILTGYVTLFSCLADLLVAIISASNVLHCHECVINRNIYIV